MEISVTRLFKLQNNSSLLAYCNIQLIVDNSIITIDDIQLRASNNGKGNWIAFFQDKYIDKNGMNQYKAINKIEGSLYFRILENIQAVYNGKEQVKAKVMIKNSQICQVEYNNTQQQLVKPELQTEIKTTNNEIDLVKDADIPF